MKRITIKDLAKMLNLATSTVSRALSDHPDISDATKSRVKAVAREFNYSTNIQAKFFRKQHSGLIALVLSEVNMFFTPNLIRGINKIIDNSKYSLIIFLTDDEYDKEKEIIQQCLNWAVKGVLISLSKQTPDLQHLEPLKQSNIKCVLLDKVLEDDEFWSVTINSTEASYNATSHLLEKGHRNILGIFGNPALDITQQRIEGYARALRERGLPVADENILRVNKSEDLDLILPSVLKHNKPISAIFTMSDELLAKSLYHLNALGIDVPEEVSVISISDGVYPYLTFPRTSHVKDSGSKMGKTACKFLLDIIAEPNAPIISSPLVPTKLVELASVAERN